MLQACSFNHPLGKEDNHQQIFRRFIYRIRLLRINSICSVPCEIPLHKLLQNRSITSKEVVKNENFVSFKMLNPYTKYRE